MINNTRLNANPLPWLLEPDPKNPGVRYFALRDLLDRPAHDPDVIAAQAEVMQSGPVPVILNAQAEGGYWVQPGAGYAPKYQGTVWSVMFLAQLGCRSQDERVSRAIEYVFLHAQASTGAFATSGNPSGAIHCLWGNVVRAMIELGVSGDERLNEAIDSLARSITGDGYGPYLKSGVVGPGFRCAWNSRLPCAWGAIRALWAFNAVPPSERSPAIQAAVEQCIDFLLSHDLARADYPYQGSISANWFKFGYPLGYITDLLLNLEALTEAGIVDNPRLSSGVEFVLSLQNEQGRWMLEYSYPGKMWINIERKGQPSKWVTLRALRVLKRLGMAVGK